MPEVAAAAEESREEVKGVMMAAATTLLPLFEAFVAILVVDLACFGFGEGFVCFCDFDEFLFGGFIASASSIRNATSPVCSWIRTGSYRDGISCSVFGRRV
jgi:hypothetical protein